MREFSVRTPSLGDADGGHPDASDDSGLSLTPPPFRTAPPADDDALRLDLDHRAPDARPRRPRREGPPRGLILAGWAGVLAVVLSVGYFTQPGRTLGDDAEPPPQVAPPADPLGAPVTAPPIASDPSHFTQAATAPEVAPATPDGEGVQPDQLQIAEAAPTPPSPPPATPAAAAVTPADPPPKVDKVTAAEAHAAKPEIAKPVKPKVQKVSAETDDEPPAKPATHKAAAADAGGKDLPQLKARMSRAYAEAVKAGMPKSVLKARQAEWAVLRAKAEKKGPAAVAALYRTRAAQLEALTRKNQAHTHAKT